MVTANQWLRVVSFLLVLSFTQQTLADIYKCQRPDGSTRFTDTVCKEGPTEALTLIMNSPLDSTAERANIAAYQANQAKKIKNQRRRDTAQQVVFIADTSTEERNARITEQESDSANRKDRKSQKRGKSKKKAKKPKKTKSTTTSKSGLKQKKAD